MEKFFTYLNWVSVLVSLIAIIYSIYNIRKTKKELDDYQKRLEIKKNQYKDKTKEI